MKKYILIPYANLNIGGIPTKIIDIVNEMGHSHDGFRIGILLQKGKKDDLRTLIQNKNVTIYDAPYTYSLGRSIVFILWFWWHTITHKPSTILAFISPYALPAISIKCILFWRHIRVVVSEDHYTQTMLNRMAVPWLQKLLIRLLYPLADTIIVPTAAIQDQLRKLSRLPKNKTVIVSNWTRFAGKPLPRHARKWDVIHIGRLVESKNPLSVVHIMAEYIRAHPKSLCAIVGEGEETSHIKQYIHENHLDKHIALYPATPDVSTYLHQAKILLFLPEKQTEGFPMIILEAMACGAVVITEEFDGIKEIITDTKNGLILKNRDYALPLISNAINNTQIQKNARSFVTIHASPRNIHQYISALLISYTLYPLLAPHKPQPTHCVHTSQYRS